MIGVGTMTLEELDPELFTLELYNPNGLWELSDALYVAPFFGYCDASRLQVRPKDGEYALMIEWENGTKYWCHINKELLESISHRLERRKDR